jgi:hypothetical protein
VRHPLTRAVASALPRPRPRDAAAFLALVDKRMKALERGTLPVCASGERGLARRFLRGFEESWDDGDENLVRGYLDRWARGPDAPDRAAALSLLEAAGELTRVGARPGALFFFLWEMESMLASSDGPC